MVLIVEITAAETLDLRSRVLRGGGGHDGFPEDKLPGTFHVGAREGDVVVGVAILDHAVAMLRERGAHLAWANGRDTALGFYQRSGWTVVGAGYVLPVGDEGGMPHHRVELVL